MNISININANNTVFSGRHTIVSKETMDKVLFPLLNDDKANIKSLAKKSGYTYNAIVKWFKVTFGISANEYFKNRQSDLLRKEITDLYNKGFSISEIANHYGASKSWAYNQYRKFGLKPSFASLNERLDKELPDLIKEGYTTSFLAKKIKCSEFKIIKWVHEHLNNNIIQFRHSKNIPILHEDKKISQKEKAFIEKSFAEKKTLAEIADSLGVSKTTVLRLKNKYDIKTDNDRKYELMDMFLDDMVKFGDKITTMSKFFGLSEATIQRTIKNKYGKNYSEIKFNK